MSIRTNDRFFVSFDKTPIHYLWVRAEAPPKAAVVIVHGSGEYGGRYREFAGFLAENGYSVYALDLRGFGESGGDRAFVANFDEYAKDILALVRHAQNESKKAVFLLGHSLGGLIAAYIAANAQNTGLAGLILSSPCFELAFPVPGYLILLAEIMALVWPKFLHKTPIQPQRLTHDPDMIDRYLKDHKILHRISSRLYVQMTRQFMRLGKIATGIRCPVLVAQAGEDAIVDQKASSKFYNLLTQSDKKFILYDGFRHEILNETERKRPYQDILQWLDQHQGSVSSQ